MAHSPKIADRCSENEYNAPKGIYEEKMFKVVPSGTCAMQQVPLQRQPLFLRLPSEGPGARTDGEEGLRTGA